MTPSPAATAHRRRTYSAQDGLRLFFRDYGTATARPSLVCLGGMARNSEDFVAVAHRHRDRRRVICPDLRGRGESTFDPNWRNYTGATYVNDLMHLLTVTNSHRVVLLGTSMGGLLSMALSVFMPSAIAGVIINDVGPEVPDAAGSRILDHLGNPGEPADWDAAVAELKGRLPGLSFDTAAQWRSFAETQYRDPGDGPLVPKWDPAIVKPLVEGTEEAVDMWPLFRALRHVPLLVLRGAISDVLPADTLARMADEHSGLRSVVVPGVGHCPTLAEPEAESALDDFLAAL